MSQALQLCSSFQNAPPLLIGRVSSLATKSTFNMANQHRQQSWLDLATLDRCWRRWMYRAMKRNLTGIVIIGLSAFVAGSYLAPWPAKADNGKQLYEITTPQGSKYLMQSDELYGWQILTDPKNPGAGITIARDGKQIASISEASDNIRFIVIHGSNNPLGGVRVTDKRGDGYLDEITYFPKGGITIDSDFDGQADTKISLNGDTLHWYQGGWWVEKKNDKNGTYIERNGVRVPASYSSGKWVFGSGATNPSNTSFNRDAQLQASPAVGAR
jgi:hypothetical protein